MSHKTISIYLASQFSDVIAVDELFPMENYAYPIISNEKMSNETFDKFSANFKKLSEHLNLSDDCFRKCCQAVIDTNINKPDNTLFNFNQKLQFRIDVKTEHGMFSFVVVIMPQIGLFNYLNFSIF